MPVVSVQSRPEEPAAVPNTLSIWSDPDVGFLLHGIIRSGLQRKSIFTMRDKQSISAMLSSNKLFAIPLLQHRFHFVQAIDGGAHLRLIIHPHCLGIRKLSPKIHLHLALFLGDDGLNDRRGLLWSGVGLA